MCGICGVLNYSDPSKAPDESLLVRMRDSLIHRGPDDAGVYIDPQHGVGLGFRRLSIVDLSPAAHQPMSTPDGSVTIVFNGEIYNHLRLRAELEGKGYRYRSRSDTETILYTYLEHGLDFVHKLLGMFSVALWDRAQRRLVLARDRIGIKPLYYTFADGTFVFGSEIKAIVQHPNVRKEFNSEALDAYLTFLVSPAPTTMFRDINKLEPGSCMVVGSNGRVSREQYWNPVPSGLQPSIDIDGTPASSSRILEAGPPKSDAECIGTIRSLLKQSVKDRMMSDVPFGVFLSGGIDSSTNVALMAELMDRPVDTFSVGFRDLEKYNELGFARQIAREFNTNHHEVIVDQKMAFEFLPKLVYHQDEPIADPVCLPLYFVSKLARDNGTIVIQVGEGSDEQFAGYPSYLRELRFHTWLWQPYGHVPKFVRIALFKLAAAYFTPQHKLLQADYIRKASEREELFWGGVNIFTETHKASLLSERFDGKRLVARELATQWHNDVLNRDPGSDYLKRMIYLEFMNRLPELLLMRVDKMSMATSIEARVPFLDHRLVEYSMTIPKRMKVRGGEPKYILKKAVEGIIPDNIIYRRKQGFAAPVNEWLRKEWYGFTESTILGSRLLRREIFRPEFIRTVLADHRTGRRDEGMLLWALLNLALWYDYWIEGRNF